MAIDVTAKSYLSPNDTTVRIQATATFDEVLERHLPDAIMHAIVEKITEKYVAEHYPEIVARLDQQAIANLAVAESGKQIAKAITEKPTVIHEKGEDRIYQRGIFGGLMRVS